MAQLLLVLDRSARHVIEPPLFSVETKETSVLILLLTFFTCIYVLLNIFVANDHILNFFFSWCSVATSGLKILSVHFSTFVTFFFFFILHPFVAVLTSGGVLVV